MKNKQELRALRSRLLSWVDGDQKAPDRTLFIMEQRQPRHIPRVTEAEHEARERQRLHHFFNWYPLAALLLCAVLTAVIAAAVVAMPGPGTVEPGESLAAGSWELELLGESCLLFLAISGVRVLLRGRDTDRSVQRQWPELNRHLLLAGFLAGTPLLIILVAALGGIAGGAAAGALLAVPPLLTGREMIRSRGYAQAWSLLLCVVLSGVSIYAGTNGYPEAETLAAELLELTAGMSAACAVYSLCSLAAENRAMSPEENE